MAEINQKLKVAKLSELDESEIERLLESSKCHIQTLGKLLKDISEMTKLESILPDTFYLLLTTIIKEKLGDLKIDVQICQKILEMKSGDKGKL